MSEPVVERRVQDGYGVSVEYETDGKRMAMSGSIGDMRVELDVERGRKSRVQVTGTFGDLALHVEGTSRRRTSNTGEFPGTCGPQAIQIAFHDTPGDDDWMVSGSWGSEAVHFVTKTRYKGKLTCDQLPDAGHVVRLEFAAIPARLVLEGFSSREVDAQVATLLMAFVAAGRNKGDSWDQLGMQWPTHGNWRM